MIVDTFFFTATGVITVTTKDNLLTATESTVQVRVQVSDVRHSVDNFVLTVNISSWS